MTESVRPDGDATERATPGTPSRRRRRWPWYVGGAVAALALLVLLLPTLLGTSWMRGVIHSWLRDNVDREVTFADLDVSWGGGIELRDLRVRDPEQPEPFLEAPLVRLDAPLLPLLRRQLLVEEFVVENPTLRLVQEGAGETNADDVVKRKKVRKKGRDGEEEALVLPDVRVPVTVRNLTLVYRTEDGRTASRRGIDFDGVLNTRAGPTTFLLRVPAREGGLRAEGRLALFDEVGTWLPAERRELHATLTIDDLDARENADLIALALGERPVAGVLDARVDVHSTGDSAEGELDLRLRDLAFDEAVARRKSSATDDLVVTGAWKWGDGRFRLDGWKARAEGLVLDADLAGTWEAIEGRAVVDADFARLADTLRAIGLEFEGGLAGRLTGEMEFTPAPSRGTGRFELRGLRVEGLVEDRPPVEVSEALLVLSAVPSKERFTLESAELRLPDLVASLHGTRESGGRLDLHGTVAGDLGGLLDRVRNLGFLPEAFNVNGTLDAAVDVTGNPRAETAAEGLVVSVPKLLLTEQDVRIEASGRRTGDGTVDFRASGRGDLGNLLGRARAASDGPAVLDSIRGRFEFQATGAGPPHALRIAVPRFHLDGDVVLDAQGELLPQGTIAGRVDADARIPNLVLLVQRLGLFDRELPLDGRVRMMAVLGGSRSAPAVPEFTLRVDEGPLRADAKGSVGADGAVSAEATLEAALADLSRVAVEAGYLERPLPVTGRLTVRGRAEGTRDSVAFPSVVVRLREGPADVDLEGSLDPAGRVTANATVTGALDDLARTAHEQGWLERRVAPGGRLTLRAVAAGPRDALAVPSFDLTVEGPLDLRAAGSLDSVGLVKLRADASGALQPLLDLAAAWTGEPAQALEGTFEAAIVAEGPRARLDVQAPKIVVKARRLSVEAAGARRANGDVEGRGQVVGPLADLLALVQPFGVAEGVRAEGRVDLRGDARMTQGRTEGSLTALATDLVVHEPEVGGAPFREPRLSVSIPSFSWTEGKLAPVRADVELTGAKLEVTAASEAVEGEGAAPAGSVVVAEGRVRLERAFAENHPELLGGGTFESVEGPFRFRGDVSRGRAGAESWTGGFELDVTGYRRESVDLASAHVEGRLAGGELVVDPFDGKLNGGTVKATARIGLVGERPAHRLDLEARQVELDAELAPILARASPLLAVGESGTAGGKADVTAHLTARGLERDVLERTLAGEGVLRLEQAYVASADWLGTVLQLVGGSDRLQFQTVTVPFTVKDGQVVTGDLPAEAVGLLLRLGGSVSLKGDLDYRLRIKPKQSAGTFARFASMLDPEGFLPLRLRGTVSDPDLDLPDLKDALLDRVLGGDGSSEEGLRDLLDRLRGKRDDEPEEEPTRPRGKRRRRKAGDAAPETAPETAPESDPEAAMPEEEPPPPPPPPASEDRPGADEDPPPPPPEDDPPPPPPPKKRRGR